MPEFIMPEFIDAPNPLTFRFERPGWAEPGSTKLDLIVGPTRGNLETVIAMEPADIVALHKMLGEHIAAGFVGGAKAPTDRVAEIRRLTAEADAAYPPS